MSGCCHDPDRSKPISYTDLYRVSVKSDLESAQRAQTVWQDDGALSYVAHRAQVGPDGRVTSPLAVKLAEDEVLYLGRVTFRDRDHRDAARASVFDDPRIQEMMKGSAANMRHMIFGGFESII